MCNDFGNHIPYSDYLAAFSQTRVPVKWPTAAPNLEPREDIWPTDKAPVVRRLEDGINEFTELRWGFPPARPKGPPVINFRSEGRRFPVGRCLVPASHFFEFTGSKSPKTKWKIHEGRRGLVLLRRAMASDAARWRSLHAADDRARTGCRADPRSADGDPRTIGLVGLA
jgi:putative SOS response-associated peptidase YedK